MLSIIIITYNNEKQITNCLESVFSSVISIPYKIILIDNNSHDKTLAVIKNLKKENISIIENTENLGFASAVNQGLKHAIEKFNSDYFLLLNPDAILEKNCISLVAKQAQESKITGLFSPVIWNPQNKSVWFSGGKINWLKFRTQHEIPLSPRSAAEALKRKRPLQRGILSSDYLTGCCLFIKKQVIEKIGMFDEKFFLYYEDADFSVRARKAGFNLKVVSDAICYHDESKSSTSDFKNYHLVKSGLLFFHKHAPKSLFPYFWLMFYTRYFYHKYISKKENILNAMNDFQKS